MPYANNGEWVDQVNNVEPEIIKDQPKWYSRNLYNLQNQAKQLRDKQYIKYGYQEPTKENLEKRKLKEEALKLINSSRKLDYMLPMSVLAKSQPMMFTPEELYQAQTDPSFARKVYANATNDLDPSNKAIKDFQARIKTKYGDLKAERQEETKNRNQLLKATNWQERLEAFKALEEKEQSDILNEASEYLKTNKIDNVTEAPELRQKLRDQLNKMIQLREKQIKNSSTEQEKHKEKLEQYKKEAAFEKPDLYQLEGKPVFNQYLHKLSEQLMSDTAGYWMDKSNRIKAFEKKLALEEAEEKVKLNKLKEELENPETDKRLGLQREIDELTPKPVPKIASFNENHEQAENLLKQNLGSPELNEAYETIKRKSPTVAEQTQPYLNRALEDPLTNLDKYRNKYDKNVIQAFRDEAAQDFLEHDLPAINNQYASKGAFYSGAREAALDKARAKRTKELDREIIKLLHHGEEKAMSNVREDSQNQFKGAEHISNATKADKEVNLRNSEAMRLAALSKQQKNLQDITSMAGFGDAKQKQEQNEIDQRIMEFEQEKDYPWKQAEREAAILSKLSPPQQTQFIPRNFGQPQEPPGVAKITAGLMQQVPQLYQQSQQNPWFAKGGHVKKAKGGPVDKAIAEWNELKGHTLSPYEQEMLDEGRKLRSTQENPWARQMYTAGTHMLASPHKSALQALAEGQQKGMVEYDAANARNLSNKEKYVNLLGKINETKLQQHEILAHYYQTKQQHDEHKRHNTIIENNAQRHHDEMMANSLNKPYKPTVADKKADENAVKTLSASDAIEEDLNRLDVLSDKISTGGFTNQISGLNSAYVQGLLPGNEGSVEDYQEFDKVASNLANNAALAYGSKAGQAVIKAMEKAKPHRGMKKGAIKNTISHLRSVVENQAERARQTLHASSEGKSSAAALAQHSKDTYAKRNLANTTPIVRAAPASNTTSLLTAIQQEKAKRGLA